MAKAAPVPRGARTRPTSTSAPEVVDPAWLLKAFLVTVLIALGCGYATLCWLFYRGQWQLVLHPARTSSAPAAILGIPSELVRFGAASTGVPQLTGWWIPAAPGASYAHLTFLYLPGGDGSLAADGAALDALHNVGASVFAVDYRGYGQSAELHPSQRSMTEDARTAWEYLTGSRALPADRVIPYGAGLGAALALDLAQTHGLASAVILDNPDFHVMERVRKDPRTRLLPVNLLFHDRFDLRPALDEIRTPKLILTRRATEDRATIAAADPKMTVALPASSSEEVYLRAVRRFLDQYAPPSAAPQLIPKPAP
jgi:pimeloyl-ACP methyl ester carboxylesterase